MVGAALLDGDRVLVARRGARMSLPGKWEFPGGKVEPGEPPEQALVRELREELAIDVAVGAWLGRGESLSGGRRVELDVHAARGPGGTPQAREHSELRWVRDRELEVLDWAEADVPVLPAVRAALARRPAALDRVGRIELLCADWSLEPARRAVAGSRPAPQGGWTSAPEPPPPGGWTLDALLEQAERRADESGGAVLVGIDAVLGVPHAFARRLAAADFFAALRRLAEAGSLASEAAEAGEWSPVRPFFRVPPGAGGLTRFVDAAGGPGALRRQIDRRVGASSVFVLSGIPGSVGSGSRVLWRELAPRLEAPHRGFRIWPFEGGLSELIETRGVVLAELYPRAAYAAALAEALPAPPLRIAKTRREARHEALTRLAGATWVAERGVRLRGLDEAEASEDVFDALVSAAALARLVDRELPLSSPWVDPTVEGGILAAVDTEVSRSPATFPGFG